MENKMKHTVQITAFKEVETKTGVNAGRKTLLFNVVFRDGDRIKTFMGFRLFDQKIHPPCTRLGFGKILNLAAIDSASATDIYFALRDALAASEYHASHILGEECEKAINLSVFRKSDLKKFAPELT